MNIPGAHVICVSFAGTTQPPLRYSLDGVDTVKIGRSRASHGGHIDVSLVDKYVSHAHLTLMRAGGDRWSLVDDDSKNGTFVAGVPTHRCVLADGDVIEIGQHAIVFRSHARLADAVLPPLRERPEDILVQTQQFLRERTILTGRPLRLGRDVIRALLAYDWANGSGELDYALHRAAASMRNHTIAVEHLPPAVRHAYLTWAIASAAGCTTDAPVVEHP